MGPKKAIGDYFETNIGDPDGTPNVITYAQDANGLCAICHPFSEDDILFLTEYMAEAVSSGDVRLIADDKLPVDWVYVTDN
jgi:hypothetical protein